MQSEQELLEIARKARVSTFATSKELDWQHPTEKVWVQKFDGTFEVMTLKELAYETRNIDEFDGIGYSENICPAPSFEEIWEMLPPYIKSDGFKCNLTLMQLGKNIADIDYSFIQGKINKVLANKRVINNHFSEAAALLYLQLKKDGLLG